MASYYLGDTLVDDSQFTTGPDGATLVKQAAPTAPPSGGTMTPEQQAAYVAKFGAPFVADQGRVVNYGEGVSGYEGGRYLGHSQYGPTITDEKNGNLIWDGKDWVPVPDASGSLFGDFITPIAIFGSLVAGGMMLEGFSSALAGNAAAEGAALGSGISSGAGGVTGISAGAGGATGVTGSVAGLSGGVLAPATTGGLLVGSEGFLGSTGNAIGDQVLNSAGQNAIKSAVTGGDPVQGALQGAAGGLIGASGIGAGAAELVGATGDAATAITTGVNAAAGSGAMTAINGGSFSDILENSAISGVSQGAGSYVSNALDSGSNAIDRGVGGAVAGGTNAALTGGDVGTGLLTSGLAGAAGGLATDLGASPAVSGVVQGVTGGLVNSALQPDDVVNPPPATAPTATTTRPDVSSVSFSDVIPQFVDKSVEWGTRLQQSGGI